MKAVWLVKAKRERGGGGGCQELIRVKSEGQKRIVLYVQERHEDKARGILIY